MTKPFLTGSQIYGMPHADSDVDLVLLVTHHELETLMKFSDKQSHKDFDYYGRTFCVSLRFGKLNLIVTTDQDQYNIWAQGTEFLTKIKPVTKDVAIKCFDALREGNPLISSILGRPVDKVLASDEFSDENFMKQLVDADKW